MEEENLLETWRTLLECGRNIVSQLQDTNLPPEKRPSLKFVLTLVRKAYSIPKPEDVFGRRDVISKHISHCMNALMDQVTAARDVLANLVDVVYDKDDGGIELETLAKVVHDGERKLLVRMDELVMMRTMLEEAMRWESKLISLGNDDDVDEATWGGQSSNNSSSNTATGADLKLPQQTLKSAEDLIEDGRKMSFRPKNLVLLAERIRSAHELRSQIQKWNEVSIS